MTDMQAELLSTNPRGPSMAIPRLTDAYLAAIRPLEEVLCRVVAQGESHRESQTIEAAAKIQAQAQRPSGMAQMFRLNAA
jgi:hypothetical protein